MRFRHKKPPHAELVEKVLGCPVYYNEPIDRLEFDKSLVDKPMPASNPMLVKQLSKRLDKVLLSIDDPDSLRLAVYRIVERELAGELPTSANIARRLGISQTRCVRDLHLRARSNDGRNLAAPWL